LEEQSPFSNDLNNNIAGFDNSDDVINGQGGNDIINGLSGNACGGTKWFRMLILQRVWQFVVKEKEHSFATSSI
jgi:hypothetical protein